MPTYEYRCPEGHNFELFQRMSDAAAADCPECGKAAERLLSAGAGFLFKGSGFYITDYRSDSYRKKAESESAAAGKSDGSSSSDAASGGSKDGSGTASEAGAAGTSGPGAKGRGGDTGSGSGRGSSSGSGPEKGPGSGKSSTSSGADAS